MKTPLRVACLGAGYFSQFHYGSWARMSDVECVGACDTDVDRARDTGLPAFSDLGEMLAATKPDLLDIITPPVAHAAALLTALDFGVKWIICQKPFSTSLDEAQTLIEQAEKADATVIIHENFRFQPWYREIKKQLEVGAIGTPLQATFRLRPGDGQGPDAYLDRQPYFQKMPRFLVHETAVHWVDTFRYLFGNPSSVYADLRRVNPAISGEDAGYIIFDHPDGVRAIFDGNRSLDHAATNLRRTMGEALFEGTEGVLSLAGDGSVSLRKFGEIDAVAVLGPDTWDGFGGDCVHKLQSHVVDAALNGALLENSAADYLRVMEIEKAIYQSAEHGQKVDVLTTATD